MIGLTYTELLPYLLPILVVGFLFSLLAIGVLLYEHQRINKLLMGRSGISLEEAITTLGRRMKEAETFRTELEQYLKTAESRIASSIRGVGVVRFNPFKGDGSGGNQSSATALVTEGGDGFVLSTLYSRDRVSVFSKPVTKGVSQYELSEEEEQALRLAQEQTNR